MQIQHQLGASIPVNSLVRRSEEERNERGEANENEGVSLKEKKAALYERRPGVFKF